MNVSIGLENNISTMKTLSKLSYSQLQKYNVLSYYKLCAISHAAGMLANRKKSMQRGHKPRQPYARQPLLISCYGFKIIDGVLKVPVGDKQYFDIPLNNYAKQVLSDPSLTLHSFTLTASNIVSVCYSKQVTTIDYTKIAGIDRNLHNVTIGDVRM